MTEGLFGGRKPFGSESARSRTDKTDRRGLCRFCQCLIRRMSWKTSAPRRPCTGHCRAARGGPVVQIGRALAWGARSCRPMSRILEMGGTGIEPVSPFEGNAPSKLPSMSGYRNDLYICFARERFGASRWLLGSWCWVVLSHARLPHGPVRTLPTEGRPGDRGTTDTWNPNQCSTALGCMELLINT